MRVIKLIFAVLLGIACFLAIWFTIYPSVCHFFIGPVRGDDQMTKNFAILICVTPLVAIVGGVTGWRTGRRLLKKQDEKIKG